MKKTLPLVLALLMFTFFPVFGGAQEHEDVVGEPDTSSLDVPIDTVPAKPKDSSTSSVFGSKLKSEQMYIKNRDFATSRLKHFEDSYATDKKRLEEVSDDEKEQVNEQMLTHSKEILLRKIDATQNHMDSIWIRVQDNEKFTDAEKSVIESVVSDYKASVGTYKTSIAEATDLKEIRSLHTQLATSTRQSLQSVKVTMGLLNVSNANEILGRTAQLAQEIKIQIDLKGEGGADTKGVLDVYETGLVSTETAESNYQQALSLFENSATSEDAVKNAQEAHGLLISANENLRAAHTSFKQAVKLLKELKSSVPENLN